MKNESMHKPGSSVRLSVRSLQKLKDDGFKYVQVKGFTHDRRLDYVSPCYLLLIPIKEIPLQIKDKDIYEPVNSRILSDWAKFPDEGIEVLIALP